jgi:hypothetical protein
MEEFKKLNPDVPIWKRREAFLGPWIIPICIGYIIYFILWSLFWLLKWCIFSWIVPFVHWPLLCKIGMHKYRKDNQYSEDKICRVCKKLI